MKLNDIDSVEIWLVDAHELGRRIFELSQRPGVTESVRKNLDSAREELFNARVNMEFDAMTLANASPSSRPLQ